ncbi:MAG TPA: ABC-type transport auxiliary lipoprotein family protein [Stellaceae bacterium]|jgi:cholesterol transport system auxiliary component
MSTGRSSAAPVLPPSRRGLLRGGIALGAAAALPAVLPGCSGLLPGFGEPPQLYVLTPKTTFRPDLPNVTAQLLVDAPTAPAELDNARIALNRSPVTIDYFANSAWPDRAPLMVQLLLVESFQATGRITAVGRESVGLRADYVLQPELRRFQAVYEPDGPQQDRPPTIWVRFNARLVRMPEGVIIAQLTTERREQAARNTLTGIIRAFDEALGGAMKALVEWALITVDFDGQQQRQPPPPSSPRRGRTLG